MNDFIDRGRVKKVYIQGDSDYRAVPSDLNKWYVRGSDSTMTPFSAFATTRWEYGPESLVRYNGSAAYEIQGENASGASSGTAMSNWRITCRPAAPGHGAVCRCRKNWRAVRQ